ncbi:VOC family protein [Persicitalea jodogahamensis]|uniref:Bleomycin resistance protein n=1 Tax=Persicitalea jodogahamensis TaxID=402147 RepID=A0A8J3GAV2_9BACT|nr:VOC family protein [Persicitalea jodogahamensis]GHB82925.1 bleomycin resistance protein [Persicitalea jodogahamensis]
MNFIQIKETCLYVSDLARTRDFYAGQLGLEVISFVEDSHVFFRAGSSVLLCFLPNVSRVKESPPPHYGSGKLHLAFEAPAGQYENYLREIQEQGINVYHHETWARGTKSFYFDDPDGHVLEVLEPGVWD